MTNYYITDNINRCNEFCELPHFQLNEPGCLNAHKFSHIKSKSDGSKTIISSDKNITVNTSIELLDKISAQSILDLWIDEENEIPSYDIDNNLILQKKIIL